MTFVFVTELLGSHLLHENQILHEFVDMHMIARGRGYMNQCGSGSTPKLPRSMKV
jgi:hypothetical protein